jgi:hypothetical protein
MQGTIVERNGRLYVRTTISDWSKPELVICYWPVAERTGNQFNGKRPEPGDLATWQRSGFWTTVEPAGFPSTGSVLDACGGEKPCEFSEREPIPQPRARTTRYHEGRWQKLLKAGWVNA